MKNKIIKITLMGTLIYSNLFGNDVSFNIKSGWSLLGSPFAISKQEILDKTSATVIWKYSNHKWFAIGNPTISDILENSGISSFDTIQSGEGFWVNSNNIKDFVISDTTTSTIVPDNYNIDIKKGWNLVSLKDGYEDSNITNTIKSNSYIDIVWKYKDGKWKAISNLDINLEANGFFPFNTISSTEGFWVKANEDTQIEIIKPNTNENELPVLPMFPTFDMSTD